MASAAKSAFKHVKVYSASWCPYCTKAKALLKSKGVPFEEIDRDGLSATEVADLVRRSKGSETIPQIFIGDEHVGGCDDIHALDRKGQLDAKLKA